MIYIEVETPHFTFRAFGETHDQARRALRVAWYKHVAQTDADPDYIDPESDGNVLDVEPGQCYLDDHLMVANGIPTK
jgi:hypothetical protein